MSDAEDLLTITGALARHIERGEQLLDTARDLLTLTQNAETCDEQPPEELWNECRNIIDACDKAIHTCQTRSKSLQWTPAMTSIE
jgi:type VI protein secretion system component VasF